MHSTYKIYINLFASFIILYFALGLIIHAPSAHRFLQVIIFVIIFIVSGRIIAKSLSKIKFKGEDNFINTIHDLLNYYKSEIILLYILIYAVLFVYPENKLLNLIIPPDFNFFKYFVQRFYEQSSGFVVVVNRIRQMLLPLFLLAIGKLRLRYTIILFAYNMYLSFALTGYFGRGVFVLSGIAFLFYLYHKNKRYFRYTIVVLIFLLPLISWLFFQFRFLRHDIAFQQIGYFQALLEVLYSETDIVIDGESALFHQIKNYLFPYYIWLITIPVPTALLPFNILELNYEIASIITGIEKGVDGFTVSLIGIFYESIFLYGNILFVFHAVVIQLISIPILRILNMIQDNELLTGYFIANATYSLSRAGSASFFPFAINGMSLLLLLYILFLFLQKNIKLK